MTKGGFAPDALAARLKRFEALHPKRIDLSLGRIERLLARLGNPERRLSPVIHVAGTNGKGSVIADLRAILEAAGLRVHVYTSPHLVRFNERIRLAGRLIADAALLDALDRVERANKGDPITFFEATTAAAFLAFAAVPADVTLLETGLGGRLDATNVIARPAASVITPIAMDHMDFLGGTLALIAAEKAGILKPGAPAVIGPQPPEAAAVIAARAEALGAPLLRHGGDWDIGQGGGRPIWRGPGGALVLPALALEGPHQIANAGTAVMAVRALSGFTIPDGAIGRGLAHAAWPARLQRLAGTAFDATLPQGAELWLDGGHNPAAAEALRAHFGADTADPRPLHLILGMKENKDLDGFLAAFRGAAASVSGVPIPNDPNAFAPAVIADAARKLGLRGEARPSVEAAIARIAAEAKDGPPPRVLIAGSLYLAGAVLDALKIDPETGR